MPAARRRLRGDLRFRRIESIDWGRLRIELDSADTGRVYWNSNLAEYGSGDYPIVRLARPMLADCDNAQP